MESAESCCSSAALMKQLQAMMKDQNQPDWRLGSPVRPRASDQTRPMAGIAAPAVLQLWVQGTSGQFPLHASNPCPTCVVSRAEAH
eukprot:2765657-Amphidinium_carterae.1